MQTGMLTVTKDGATYIELAARPREVIVRFRPEPDPVPCNPHHHGHHGRPGRPGNQGHSDHDHDGPIQDHLEWKIDHEDEDKKDHHKIGHRHHDRKFILAIKWRVSGMREIDWFIFY